jgi:hypothetical protein
MVASDTTSSQALIEKRSKKKCEASASISVVKAQEAPTTQQDKPSKKKKKEKMHKAAETEEAPDENLQPQHDAVEGEQGEKKKKRKKRKHSKSSSFSDNSNADESKLDDGNGSSPKRQKTNAKDHVQVSPYLLFQHISHLIFYVSLTSNSFNFSEKDFTIGNHC